MINICLWTGRIEQKSLLIPWIIHLGVAESGKCRHCRESRKHVACGKVKHCFRERWFVELKLILK